MDRSYLSDQAVVAASRKFVCIRLATYEDAAEAKILEQIFVGRSGQLENTVFTILSPDGRRDLVTPGRSPHWAFRDSRDMAKRMNEIAKRYHANATGELGVPYLKDVRLALNVAASDDQRLIIVHAPSAADEKRLEALAAKLAWSKGVIGKFLYARSTSKKDLAAIERATSEPGLLIVRPGEFGLDGREIAHLAAGTSEKEARRKLTEIAAQPLDVELDSRRHIREARRKGVHWETEIPVTDPGPAGHRRRR